MDVIYKKLLWEFEMICYIFGKQFFSNLYQTYSQNMTFDKLHEGIAEGCNCLDHEGISENSEDCFVRVIYEEDLSANDWKSYHEFGKLPKNKPNCKGTCKWRGVSINKLIDNREAIKNKWLSLVNFFAPKGIKKSFICIFRLRKDAGKVWDTSSQQAHAHHDLLKSDSFCLESIEVLEIIPFAEF